ncbi:peptidoglycan recognition protein [Streptomyces sp. WAC 00631]|uniref:peptidoglycan recognition protein family protein n=1 Tax=unclassified Streptomyces TaxID=2593676 RepID=UPI000F766C22|nr:MULTISPECIES: peptidoglycan recognition protein [unclassified Streptomyces]MCC5032493.1 peptidoglycan recognition protein [Streptomyces sp. WAC 00631]MCC9740597.1 peptidoglycan recognition protein [Streptomyces sp. MNU89]
MWSRRLALGAGAVVLPLALLAVRDAAVRSDPPGRHEPAAIRPAAPRPAIVSRQKWDADEDLVRERAPYSGAVSAVFVHHTGHPNGYDCADVPELLRSLQTEHVTHEGWDDIGYNFVVDRCGTIYEGRAGSASRPVRGAHAKGFNAHTVGIAALGTFTEGVPVPGELIAGMAKVAAWKLRPGADPRGTVRLTSSNDESRYDKGDKAELNVISGHRDGYETDCPGEALYQRLPALREAVARLRDR